MTHLTQPPICSITFRGAMCTCMCMRVFMRVGAIGPCQYQLTLP